MDNLLNKRRLGILFALMALSATTFSLKALDYSEQPSYNRLYVGAFGGGIYSNSSKVSQFGTAFFPEDVLGPLSIIAKGHKKKLRLVSVAHKWDMNGLNRNVQAGL